MLYKQWFIDDRKNRADLVRRARLVFVCFVLFASIASGQGEPKAVLHDEFSNAFCSEIIKLKLDILLATLSDKPESIGYIVANADAAMPGRFHKYFRTFQNHVRYRRFDPDRIKYFRGPDKDSLWVQLWVVPKGAASPEVELRFQQKPIIDPVLFDASEITSVKNGEVEFGGDWGGEPCDFGLDLNMFAIYLGGNPELEAYLVASSASRRERSKAQSALRLTAAKLAKEHGILRSRIKTLFAGDKENSEMQLWLVPKDTKPPEFTSRLP